MIGRASARAVGLLAALAGCAPERNPAALGTRLIDRLPWALEVPRLPRQQRLLELDVLAAAPGARTVGLAFAAAPMKPFVFRLRLGKAAGLRADVHLRALDTAQAAAFGPEAKTLEGPLPGRLLGPCVSTADEASPGAVVCQRLDHLVAGEAKVLVVVNAPGRGVSALEAWEAQLPDRRAPRGPVLTPLVHRVPATTDDHPNWRTAMVAPATGRYLFQLTLPPRAELRLATGLMPHSRSPMRFVVRVQGLILLDEVVRDQRWHEHTMPLSGVPGSEVSLALEASALEPGGEAQGAWADARLVGSPEGPRPPSILLVTLDAARPDHLSAYGYGRDTTPALAAVAAAGARFERATAQAPNTWQSAVSFLSGLQPDRDGVRGQGWPIPGDLALLPDLLAGQGYDTVAGSDLAQFPPGELSSFGEEEIYSRRETGLELRRLGARLAQRPTFAWVHLEDPHYSLEPRAPRRYDPDYRGRFAVTFTSADNLSNGRLSSVTPAECRHITALYDSALRDADDALGQFLIALEQAGGSDHTIIAVTADHATMLCERGVTLQHLVPRNRVLHVPLVISWPGHIPAGAHLQQRVQLVDLVPTLLSLAGLSAAPRLDGRDLTPLLNGKPLPDLPAYAAVSDGAWRARYLGDEMLLVNPSGVKIQAGRLGLMAGRRELHDVALDPGEVDDQSARKAGRTLEAERELEAQIARWTAQGGHDQPFSSLGQAAISALRQAGYLPAPARGQESAQGVDGRAP